jgi:hypothetical protein
MTVNKEKTNKKLFESVGKCVLSEFRIDISNSIYNFGVNFCNSYSQSNTAKYHICLLTS